APSREHSGVGGSALGAQQVGAFQAALKAGDEDQPPDHKRRAENEDAGLAQRLAKEAQDAAAVDLAHHRAAKAGDLAQAVNPGPRQRQPAGHQRAPLVRSAPISGSSAALDGWRAGSG